MVNEITTHGHQQNFEAGTIQAAESGSFTTSIKFIQDLGIKNEKHESQILEYGLEKLRKIIL